MLSIARHTDYAARIVLHLATLGEESQASLPAIAEARLMPLPFARRLISRLVRAKILVTVRGVSGGIRLARAPGDITLLEVIEAMEGGVRLNRCVENPQVCALGDRCSLHGVWNRLNAQVRANLAETDFEMLAREELKNAGAH